MSPRDAPAPHFPVVWEALQEIFMLGRYGQSVFLFSPYITLRPALMPAGPFQYLVCVSPSGFQVGELSSAVLGRRTPSLSKTCEAWLGKPLDKTECASKWASR